MTDRKTSRQKKIKDWVTKNINLQPTEIERTLRLKKPIYLPTASYGHFGRKHDVKNGFFTWEALDIAEKMQNSF